MNRKLIITADDYGMCDAVNEAIEECMAVGVVRATCVMTNMPAYSAVSNLRGKFPQSSIGIHWTLTDGGPVLSPSQVLSLVGTDGKFYSASPLRRRWIKGKINPKELKAELLAQYQRFSELAGEPDFWNTHQNVHVFPGLFETCVAVGQELQIPAMRCHRRFTVPRRCTAIHYNVFHPVYWLKGLGISRWSRQAEGKGVLLPDGLVHMPDYECDISSLEHIAKCLRWDSIQRAVEFVIHPAINSHEKLFNVHPEQRVLEYELFRNPQLLKQLSHAGVEPVGYEVLYESR